MYRSRQTEYRLHYFNLRGRAETIRQLFAYAGVPYEDIRVTGADWKELKQTTPFGSMPVLEVDGRNIPQSYAIARYLARKFDLAGKDEIEEAWVDALADQHADYYSKVLPYFGIVAGRAQGDKETVAKEVAHPARDAFYSIIEKRLGENPAGFLVGDGPTWIDFHFAEQVATTNDLDPDFLNDFSNVQAHAEKIRGLPQIKQWVEERPQTAF